MLTLGEFKSELRSQVGRGAALDAELDGFIRRAVQYIERRHSFRYMYHFNEFTLNLESQFPRTIKITDSDVKSIDFIRFRLSGGKYSYLESILPDTQVEMRAEMPTQFWMAQENLLILASMPQESYHTEIGWYEKSSFGRDDNFSHWLLRNFEDGLLARTQVYIGQRLRDPARITEHAALFEDAFTSLIMEEEESGRLTSDYTMGLSHG